MHACMPIGFRDLGFETLVKTLMLALLFAELVCFAGFVFVAKLDGQILQARVTFIVSMRTVLTNDKGGI